MKKLLLLIGIVLFFSCEKIDEDVCKTCTTIITQDGGGYASGKIIGTSTFKACGNDLRSVDGNVTKVTTGGFTITSRTNCK